MDRGLADAKRKIRTFQREQIKSEKAAARDAKRKAKDEEKSRAKNVGGIASGVAQGFGQVLGVDAIGTVKDIASEVLDYERALTRLQITANASPETMRAFSDSIMQASNATGL